MRRLFLLVIAVLYSLPILSAQAATSEAADPAPPMSQIKMSGAVAQMFVDGKPFIILGGELHNSSASSIEYMKPDRKSTRLNSSHIQKSRMPSSA